MSINYCFGACPPRPDLWELRVLVVNSDLSTANTILFELEALGAKGIAVENFEQAINISQVFHPNVLVTKLHPSILENATSLNETKKQMSSWEKPPLAIAITDFPWVLDRTSELKTEFQYHLFDSVDSQSLASRVKQLIQEKSYCGTHLNSSKASKVPMERKVASAYPV